jgi:hypothetical protein
MTNNFKSNLDKIIEEEKRGQEATKAAIREREEKLNIAREEANKEINIYADEMNKFLTDGKATVNIRLIINR